MCPSCAFPAVPISKGGGVYTCTVIACILIPAWASTPSFHDRIPVETRLKPHRNTHSSQLGDLGESWIPLLLLGLFVSHSRHFVCFKVAFTAVAYLFHSNGQGSVLPSVIPRRVSESPGWYRWVGSMEFVICSDAENVMEKVCFFFSIHWLHIYRPVSVCFVLLLYRQINILVNQATWPSKEMPVWSFISGAMGLLFLMLPS